MSSLKPEQAIEVLVNRSGNPNRANIVPLCLEGIPRQEISRVKKGLSQAGLATDKILFYSFFGSSHLELAVYEKDVDSLVLAFQQVGLKCFPLEDPLDSRFYGTMDKNLSDAQRLEATIEKVSRRLRRNADQCGRSRLGGWFRRRLHELQATVSSSSGSDARDAVASQ